MTDIESVLRNLHYGIDNGKFELRSYSTLSDDKVSDIRKYNSTKEVLEKYINMNPKSFCQLLYDGNLFNNILYQYTDDFRKDGIDIDAEIRACKALKDDIMELKKRWFGSKDSIREIENILYEKVCGMYKNVNKYVENIRIDRFLMNFIDKRDRICNSYEIQYHKDCTIYPISYSYVYVYVHANKEVRYYRFEHDYSKYR